ncbi:hypothetical protein PFISCL1PPCAC_4375, partial [Pristionchus fissidentatus]
VDAVQLNGLRYCKVVTVGHSGYGTQSLAGRGPSNFCPIIWPMMCSLSEPKNDSRLPFERWSTVQGAPKHPVSRAASVFCFITSFTASEDREETSRVTSRTPHIGTFYYSDLPPRQSPLCRRCRCDRSRSGGRAPERLPRPSPAAPA